MKNRYPGTQPFTAEQKDLFYGRKQETDDMMKRIRFQQMVVLYGKSGLGKSSLLNASIKPKVEAANIAEVFAVRFNAWTEGAETPLSKTASAFLSSGKFETSPNLSDASPTFNALEPIADGTLWYAAKARQIATEKQRFLLVFDQFEELFTYPDAAIQEFKESLAELMRAGLPKRIEENIKNLALSDDDLDTLYETADIKVLFAIRSDRMHLLDKLSDVLPDILRHCYELKALIEDDAKEAMTIPASLTGDFDVPPFTYTEGGLKNILSFLKDEDGRVEAIQLQTLCQAFERTIKREGQSITAADTPEDKLKAIIDDYYQTQLHHESITDTTTAHRLIEDELVIETGDNKGVRVTLHELSILVKFAQKDKNEADERYRLKHLLDALVNVHLLRREVGSRGGDTYELSHDRLIEPVLKSKKVYEEEVEAEKEYQEYIQKKEATENFQRRFLIEQKRRQTISILAISALIGLVVAIWFYQKANNATIQADKAKEQAEKISRASQNTALALQLSKEDSEIALSIAGYNLTNHSDNASVVAVANQLTDSSLVVNKKSIIHLDFHGTNYYISPNGKKVVTTNFKNALLLWDISTQKVEKIFIGHSENIISVAFSPDGKKILTGCSDSIAKLWNISSGQIEKTFIGHSDRINSVAFSPDSKQILTGSNDKTAKLWDVTSGRIEKTFKEHSREIISVGFSPDGKQFLTGSRDNTVKLWNISNGIVEKTLIGHTFFVTSALFSPNGKQILTGSWDHSVILWDASNGKIEKTFVGHQGMVTSIAFSPDGKKIITGSDDNTAKIWDISSGHVEKTLVGHSNSINSVAFSSDGKQVLTSSHYNDVKLWDIVSDQSAKVFVGHDLQVNIVAYSPNNTKILTCGYDNTVKLWDISSGQVEKVFIEHSAYITSAAFSPDGKKILTCGYDNKAKLWDISSGQVEKTFLGHTDYITSVAFSPSGKKILTGSQDNTAKLWDITSGQVEVTFAGLYSFETFVAFSPNEKKVLTGSWDQNVKLWDISSGKIEITFETDLSSANSAMFSPDGKKLLIGYQDNTLKLWDISTVKIEKTFVGYDVPIVSATFSPDGSKILIGTRDNVIEIRDVLSGKIENTYVGRLASVTSYAFSSDRKKVLAGCRNGTAIMWELSTNNNPKAIRILSLKELWYLGVQLEPEDLKKIGKKENLKK